MTRKVVIHCCLQALNDEVPQSLGVTGVKSLFIRNVPSRLLESFRNVRCLTFVWNVVCIVSILHLWEGHTSTRDLHYGRVDRQGSPITLRDKLAWARSIISMTYKADLDVLRLRKAHVAETFLLNKTSSDIRVVSGFLNHRPCEVIRYRPCKQLVWGNA